MANPRQRRKTRSSAHRSVKTSNAKNLRKHPAVKAPDPVKQAWDKRKTVRQNYAALGLTTTLKPHASGGSEGPTHAAVADEAPDRHPEQGTPIPVASAAGEAGALQRGYGRIVRDAEGNIVKVEIGGEARADAGSGNGGPSEEETPWGAPMEDWIVDDGSAATEMGSKLQKAKSTPVTQALDELSSVSNKITRYASTQEIDLLHALVQRHGDDFDAMVRDRKLNRWQKTAGELGRAIKKAGGIDALRTHASRPDQR